MKDKIGNELKAKDLIVYTSPSSSNLLLGIVSNLSTKDALYVYIIFNNSDINFLLKNKKYKMDKHPVEVPLHFNEYQRVNNVLRLIKNYAR